jgi:hypothetical protein
MQKEEAEKLKLQQQIQALEQKQKKEEPKISKQELAGKYPDVAQFLQSINLPDYLPNFVDNGYDSMDIIDYIEGKNNSENFLRMS